MVQMWYQMGACEGQELVVDSRLMGASCDNKTGTQRHEVGCLRKQVRTRTWRIHSTSV